MSNVLDTIQSMIPPGTRRGAIPRIIPDPDPDFVYGQELDLSDDDGDKPVATGYRQRAQWPTRTAESIAEGSSIASSVVFDDPSEYCTVSSAPPSQIGEGRNPPAVPSPPLHELIYGVNTLERLLPCELFGFGCHARFPLYQMSDWIRHLETDHLRDTIPRNSVCWWCDSLNNNRFRPVSDSNEDRKIAFRRRMHHIAGHFQDGVFGRPRPDWYLLEHLRDMGVIRPEMFNRIAQHTEAPVGTLTIDHTPSARRPPSFLRPDPGQYPPRQARSRYRPR